MLRRATDCGEGSDSGEDWGGGVTFRRMDRQGSEGRCRHFAKTGAKVIARVAARRPRQRLH
ncbi:hypothetical protein APV28_4300 [Comamonas testosteroni]|nr:hypothetical protein APV28_4300 [Comamonas testosteroni]